MSDTSAGANKAETTTSADSVHKIAQTAAIYLGIIGSVVGYFVTWDREIQAKKFAEVKAAEARENEALARQLEARVPLLKLRQERYIEICQVVVTLVAIKPNDTSDETIQKAKQRFRELYLMELAIVESPEVAGQMVALAKQIDPTLLELTPPQQSALKLAEALRKSFGGDVALELPMPAPARARHRNDPEHWHYVSGRGGEEAPSNAKSPKPSTPTIT